MNDQKDIAKLMGQIQTVWGNYGEYPVEEIFDTLIGKSLEGEEIDNIFVWHNISIFIHCFQKSLAVSAINRYIMGERRNLYVGTFTICCRSCISDMVVDHRAQSSANSPLVVFTEKGWR